MKRSILRVLISVLLAVSFIVTSGITAFAAETEVKAEAVDGNDVAVTDDIDDSYSAYLSLYAKADTTSEDVICEGFKNAVLDEKEIECEIEVAQTGMYYIGMRYKSLDALMSDFRFGIKIDGNYPYDKAKKIEFPRMWCDEKGNDLTDDLGNEFAPQQIHYEGFYYNEAIDEATQNGDKFVVYLTKGKHKVSLVPNIGKLEIEQFKFSATADIEKYKAPDKSKYYKGESIAIEAENAAIKSGYFLAGQTNTSTTKITPYSADRRRVNYIGGGNWATVGDTLVWETPDLKEGYYKIGFSFRQSTMIGGKSYRVLAIDGKVPFKEAQEVGFKYDTDWQQGYFADADNDPYLVYFSKGKHQISLSVTVGEMGEVRNLLTQAVAELGDLYVDITKITGETVDIYRDYELFKQIGDMEERLNSSRDKLEKAGKRLLEITGEKTGSNYSVINNMILAIDNMLNNKFEAHRHKSYYYSQFCSVSSVLQDLTSMPLELDKIVLCAADEEAAFAETGFFENVAFSCKRFFVSFIKDYNSVSVSDDSSKEAVTIWVNWGRDQAQVLTRLVDRSFTPKTNIQVNLKLVNASIIQALLSGKGPDCLLMHSRSEPINLAMRGVLYDLTEFSDYKEVLTRFQKGADTPYWYKDGLYALPDTQTFFVMFYRNDILNKYNIKVPETWEEFDLAAKLLMKNNMLVSMPATIAVDASTAGGVGTNNIFPSLLAQNNVPLYKDDGKATNLLSPEAMTVFEQWTNYYTKMNLSVNLDFYNRFRVGTVPLGIVSYSTYNTLMVAAPEIKGSWGFTAIPGTRQSDGTVSHASAGGGTACSILNISKNPENAWEFLKWWTSADTQLSYSNNIESILGPTGRIALSNVEAINNLSWEEGALEELNFAWEQVEEVPEYPGSYYVSRSIYQAFWNVVNANKNTKDMLMKFGKEANDEIARKWKQYSNRK